MVSTLKNYLLKLLHIGPLWVCKLEFKLQKFTRFNERPIEYGFVFRKLAQIYPCKVLDVGTGTTALPRLIRNCGCHVTAIDNIKDYWPSGMFNRFYYVMNDDITNSKIVDKFDLITCVSVIEHIEQHYAAVRGMINLLKPGGYLILTCPYTEQKYVRNVYDLPGSNSGKNIPFICQSYSRIELNKWLEGTNCKIVEQEYWQLWDGDYWTVGKQVIPPLKVDLVDKHQLTCVLIQKNA